MLGYRKICAFGSKNMLSRCFSSSILTADVNHISQTSSSEILLPLAPKILRPRSYPTFVAPVAESCQPKVASPFPTHVQAWLRDFKTNKVLDIINISADVFAAPLRRDLLQRAVVYERDGLRQGTASALSKSEVSGTGKKAFAQKGRGKARVHSLRAPQFRGGGRAFPVKPRDFSTEIQEKVFRHALRVLFSTKYAQNQLILVDKIETDSHKTKDLYNILAKNNWESILFFPGQQNDYLELATRNIQKASVGDFQDPKIYQMMLHNYLVLDKLTLAYFEDTLLLD